MATALIWLLIPLAAALAYLLGKQKARDEAAMGALQSLPGYYGLYALLWCALPMLAFALLGFAWQKPAVNAVVLRDIPALVEGLDADQQALYLGTAAAYSETGVTPPERLKEAVTAYSQTARVSRGLLIIGITGTGIAGLAIAMKRIHRKFPARNVVDRVIHRLLMGAALVSIAVTAAIAFSILSEAVRFFAHVPFWKFLFGLEWSPQLAIRADQAGASGAFGAVPLFTGTLLITLVAMLVAVPVGLMSAIYMVEYASPRTRSIYKPVIEILAGIPTVVYGFFAAILVGPLLRDLGDALGLAVSSESALAAGLVMGIMIIPYMASLSDDAIHAVPQTLRDASLAMGSTPSETVCRVVLPAALPGIMGAFLLAVSRAIGETMIVVMAAGLSANLTLNPLESVTTVTAQMVKLLVGDQEFDSPKTMAAFALGLTLFIATLLLNVAALRIVRKYRERYE